MKKSRAVLRVSETAVADHCFLGFLAEKKRAELLVELRNRSNSYIISIGAIKAPEEREHLRSTHKHGYSFRGILLLPKAFQPKN